MLHGTVFTKRVPLVHLSMSEVKILADGVENNKRKLHFNLSSSRQANSMRLFFHKDAGISDIKIDGKPIEYKQFYSVEKSGCRRY